MMIVLKDIHEFKLFIEWFLRFVVKVKYAFEYYVCWQYIECCYSNYKRVKHLSIHWNLQCE
jgi:hypothetical protein